ncbi:hypothetical protein [Succiniclasticum ruminis]|uniref:Uncharacterized protein n=1 Tax=Succiniclasticum ruminis DSM 9236 TaxID=1123323 RepID=A0A1I2BYE4_9FIRM|nr:hypothetical protein [Succiniclasticum ruminis]SFE61151.1 hypothetical protein SAMN05216245_11056 [Succiniclasticum ruminis DSM 9236]
MNGNLKITIAKTPPADSIINMKPVCLREKVLRWLFGVEQKILVLAPADEVEQVEIVKGGTQDGG